MDPAAGRARGRPRGGPGGPNPRQPAPQAGGDGDGAALRGRGGVRLAPYTQLITKPANVTVNTTSHSEALSVSTTCNQIFSGN